MRWRLLVVLLLVGAAGCEEGVEAQPAPACTGQLGCPAGSRCIEGVRCEREANAPVLDQAPRASTPASASSDIGRPDPTPTQIDDAGGGIDAGSPGFDAGPPGFDSGPPIFDARVPWPGCDACVV